MRKFIVLSFLSMDGVMQGPGSPEEDNSGGFSLGGWVAPYADAGSDSLMQKILEPADLLLGRKTFEIWEQYWPAHAADWPGINDVTKYVLSTSRNESEWSNCRFMHTIEELKQLKNSAGGDIKIWGSSELVQVLLKHGLVDACWLMIHPVVLGKGKKLFDDQAVPAAFTVSESMVNSKGVVFVHYMKAGEVKTGHAGS